MSTDTSGKSAERSISYLEMITRITPESPMVYVDLSAARLKSASSTGGARALLGALDAAMRAVELSPNTAAALYDRALAADLLGLNGEASDAWHAYLGRDSTTSYADEARARLKALEAFRRPAPPKSSEPARVFADYASHAPEEARALALEDVLAEWGDATLSGDSTTAAARIEQADAVGGVLARMTKDSTLAHIVRSIRSCGRRASERNRLATLHVAYARAQKFAQQSNYPPADSGFLKVMGDRGLSPGLTALAAYGHANALIYRHRPDDALRSADSILNAPSTARYRIVGARTQWIRALILLRANKRDEGIEALHRSRDIYQSLLESDNVASAEGMEGETLLQIGSNAAGFDAVHRAAVRLRAYPTSLWRHNALVVLGRASTRAGLPNATRAIEDEDMRVVGGGTRATSVVEARLARSRSEWAAGRAEAAETALAEARGSLAHVADTASRNQLQREVSLTVATLLARSKPGTARLMLDSVIAFFAPLQFPMKLIPALTARSSIELQLGDTASARRDLDRATETYLEARSEIVSLAQGQVLLAQARAVFDALVMLQISGGQASAALRTVLRSRGTTIQSRAESSHANDRGAEITYALIGDTLLAWVISARDTSLTRTLVRASEMAHTIEIARDLLELGAKDDVTREPLSRLYEMLIRPLEPRVPASATSVAISVDGVLTSVPFEALWDRPTRTFLIERFVIRFVPASARFAKSGVPASPKVLLLSDPNHSRGADALNLAPLPGAAAEINAIRPLYSESIVLVGPTRRESLVETLERVDVVHFAGHAVLDDVEPERSFLAIGSRPFTAGEISKLHLQNLRLVVLSACETMRSAQTESGFSGLSNAFLLGGAGGVVGSLWRIADGDTRGLMVRFHAAFVQSRNAALALHDAQIQAIHSLKPVSTWAGFRYLGS